jgi:phosphohistidine phosphatase
MRYLTLIRHAKSSWKDPSLSDIDRPLNKRGRRDAPEMAARLARGGFEADLILCSPATRALATAEIFAAEIAYPFEDVAIDRRIYAADLEDIVEVITEIDAGIGSAVLIGHNPSLGEVVDTISPYLVGHLPTCGIVRFGFDSVPWSGVFDTEPSEAEFDSPRIAGLR